MNYYIGIDIGTSSTKSVIFDTSGKVIATKSYEYDLLTPKPGYAEQRPSDWLKATIGTLKDLAMKKLSIKGIGLSGQMHGLVLLDKNDNVLRNSIIWCDNRTSKEKEELENNIGIEKIKEITGNEPMAAFTLAKLLWVKNNEPQIYKQIDKVMLPKDYIRYMLTNSFKTEYSDASGMQLLDIRKKEFSKELLDYLELKQENFPELIESSDISGYLKSDIQELFGEEPVFVVGGAGDQAASAVGNGIIKKGDLSIVLGSSGVLFTPIDKSELDKIPAQVFMHAIPNTYHMMGVTNGCGLSYKWFKESMCNDEIAEALKSNQSVYDILNKEAESANAGSNGLIYLPYLNGERTPHPDSYASGTFIGIRQNTSKNDFVRSILEGVSYSLRDCYEFLPKEKYKIFVSGGGAKGLLWRQIIASNLHQSVCRIEQEEGGALGVAILAMVANKEYSSIEEACNNIISIKDETKPVSDWYDTYSNLFEVYKDTYQALKNVYVKQTKILGGKE